MQRKTIVMVRPAAFGYNPETALDNAFQQQPEGTGDPVLEAQKEFDGMVESLRNFGVTVFVVDDPPEPITPDAVFPNNWVSFEYAFGGNERALVTYPMYAPTRRLERNPVIINQLIEKFKCTARGSFEHFEQQDKFLEGTGSMVFDRPNKIAYACESQRTTPEVFEGFCSTYDFYPHLFIAQDRKGKPIYHTNVMMNIGHNYAVVCMESVIETDRQALKQQLESTGKEIIDISFDQMEAFAGNMFEVTDNMGNPVLVMSQTAYHALTPQQQQKLSAFARLLPIAVPTIERLGGGSVRCMMAEAW